MAVAKAKNHSAAMILLARRRPDIVYEYSGWQIARYLKREAGLYRYVKKVEGQVA